MKALQDPVMAHSRQRPRRSGPLGAESFQMAQSLVQEPQGPREATLAGVPADLVSSAFSSKARLLPFYSIQPVGGPKAPGRPGEEKSGAGAAREALPH